MDVLQQDFWVPGSTNRSEIQRFQGKPLFKEILVTSLATCNLWMTRATEDWRYNFVVPLNSISIPISDGAIGGRV